MFNVSLGIMIPPVYVLEVPPPTVLMLPSFCARVSSEMALLDHLENHPSTSTATPGVVFIRSARPFVHGKSVLF
ncbi:Hypothetical protein NTJ_13085 [Nesidiocoris tenuis]|uniref:Secreted protein n=1 Tax=Nesidiocoris tenuis TaxID=355587 RepID=A0ABN7B7P2_9HEMI|nr:Hypothetical protein NTJ_13085 [Nesidiocoris tenuis]